MELDVDYSKAIQYGKEKVLVLLNPIFTTD